jgi:hypothetical protein
MKNHFAVQVFPRNYVQHPGGCFSEVNFRYTFSVKPAGVFSQTHIQTCQQNSTIK